MKYTEFVKANYSKVADLPAKQRMAKLGQMWKASGHASAKGKGVVGGSEGGIFIKRKGGKRGKKQVKGKGLLSMLSPPLGIFGLGMPEDKGATGGKMKKVRGKGIISDALGAFGLGVEKKSRGRPSKGKGVAGGSVAGGEVAGGEVAGGGILSGLLSEVGLGMPNKIKQKHFNRMVALDKQLHSKGKLTPVQHNKLKVYHHLHGAGFFDSLFSNIKAGVSKVASIIPQAITTIPQVLKVLPEVAKFVPAVGKLAGPLAKVAPLAAML